MEHFILLVGLALILYFDGRYRKIPNGIVVPMVVLGFVINTVSRGWEGMSFSGLGFIVGLALLFIPYALRGVGAGDVKLLAAIGALMGAKFVLTTFLYGAVIGGLWAMVILFQQKILGVTLQGLLWNATVGLVNGAASRVPLRTLAAGRTWGFPYGVAMAIGALIVLYHGVWF